MIINKVKDKLNHISIKWKFFIYLLGFCTVLIIILWTFQVLFLQSFYTYTKTTFAKTNAEIIAKNINNKNIQDLLNQVAIDNDFSIEVWSDDGEKIYSSYNFKSWFLDSMNVDQRKLFISNMRQLDGPLLVHYNKDGFINVSTRKIIFNSKVNASDEQLEQSIIYSEETIDRYGNTNFIVISAPIRKINETVSTIRVQLYYITIIMILFSTILAFIIARRVAKPIEMINKSAKKVSQGQYEIDFNGSGYQEINELSNTLTILTKELSKVENLRRELIANISHDLRTPLTLIKGYSEIMRDLPNENNVENAQIIIDETERLTTLVNDILDLSKFQSGVQILNINRYNLTQSLNAIIIRMNKLTKKDGYNIQFIYDKEVMVEADETKISQCFYNLLINAINYTGEEKVVIVLQSVENKKVKIKVVDTGEGIIDNDLPYVWDRYYKINKNHKRPITGTGLGLSIVKSVIELHEGQYGVESERGNGSTFWFEIKI